MKEERVEERKDRKEGGIENRRLSHPRSYVHYVIPSFDSLLSFLSFLAFVLIWSPIQVQSSALLPDEK